MYIINALKFLQGVGTVPSIILYFLFLKIFKIDISEGLFMGMFSVVSGLFVLFLMLLGFLVSVFYIFE